MPGQLEPKVAPPIYATPAGTTRVVVKRWFEVRIAQHGSNDYSPVYKAAMGSRTHYVYQNLTGATKSEIVKAMQEAVAGEIFTSDTHCHLENEKTMKAIGIKGDGWQILKDSEVILLKEMAAALKTGAPPAAAVVCGCNSADLIADLVRLSGVGVAFGIGGNRSISWDGSVKAMKCTAVAQQITAALVLGKTLAEAKAAGDAEVMSDGLEVQIETASGVDVSRSLKDNGLIPDP